MKGSWSGLLCFLIVPILACCGSQSGNSSTYSIVLNYQGGVSGLSVGTGSISGTVTLPSTISTGYSVTLFAYPTDKPNTSSTASILMTMNTPKAPSSAASLISYSIQSLPTDSYTVCIVCSQGSPNVQIPGIAYGYSPRSGDLYGCYNGTQTAPIQDPSQATPITVSTTSLTALNFGLATVP